MSYYEYHVAKRYVQFDGALKEFARYAALIGKRVLVLTACGPATDNVVNAIMLGMKKKASEMLRQDLVAESSRYAGYSKISDHLDDLLSDLTIDFHDLGDPIVSAGNVKEMAELVREKGYDVVAGVGGGKGMDFARAITHFLPVKVILVPTLCATNASISTLSVIYSDDGKRIQEYWRMDNAPELVLADTELLVRNGTRILAAGMGDIMATYYEAVCNVRLAHDAQIFSDLANEGVRCGINIILKRGTEAMQAVRQSTVTPAFESVLSLILHNCGPMWTICSMGLAHVLDEVFLGTEQSHKTLHGLRVGYGVIAMLKYQQADEEEVGSYVEFCRNVGIPTRLKEMDMDGISREEWLKLAKETVEKTETLRGLPYEASIEDLIDCMLEYEKNAGTDNPEEFCT